MEIKNVFVLGAGTMGAGIAQLFSQIGCSVVLSDVTKELADKGLARVARGLEGRVAKGKMAKEDMDAILGRIKTTSGLDGAKDADWVLEAIVEDVEVKKSAFRELDGIAPAHAVLATNTTSCSMTEIASAAKRPERVVGMHFFNPPQVMKLVEIMPGLRTSEETVAATKALAEKLGKTPVVCKAEGPAGIASRVLAGLLNEAVWVLAEGIGTVEDIDKAMKLGSNLPMGPFELIDLIGVDVHLAKTQTLYQKLGDARYRPCFLLEKMVRAGYLGRKAQRGFYDYSQDPPAPVKLL